MAQESHYYLRNGNFSLVITWNLFEKIITIREEPNFCANFLFPLKRNNNNGLFKIHRRK